MNDRIAALEAAITALEARNARVEANKAWETSRTRRALLATLTYGVMVLVMVALSAPTPFTGALIPTLGFVLSTLSLEAAKAAWLKKR